MKFGVIGMGNMGSTILKAAIQSDYVKAYETNIYDVNPDQCKKFSDVYAVNVMESNLQLVKESDFILLAVKPQYMKGLLQEIQRHVRNKRLISIAAGWTMEMLQDGLLVHDTGTQLLRVIRPRWWGKAILLSVKRPPSTARPSNGRKGCSPASVWFNLSRRACSTPSLQPPAAARRMYTCLSRLWQTVP